MVLGTVGCVAMIRNTAPVRVFAFNLITSAAILIPLLQFAGGQIPFFGQAFMASLYLTGFLLAQIAGQRWQQWKPVMLGDILFGAIGIASLVSVGLQLYQWLGLTRDSGMIDIWVIGFDGARPAANLGQPNQLSTLLMWGLLAGAWGVWRKQLRGPSIALYVLFLLVGLALAQSRTALLSLLVMTLLFSFWRPLGRQKKIRAGVVVGCVWYLGLLVLVPGLSQLLLLEGSSSMQSRGASELRPAAWNMFLDAVSRHPWLGYGWDQVMSAHLEVGERHPRVGHLFGQTHNLFLDLIVWTGVPAGMFLSACLIAAVIVTARRVANVPQALYFMLIAVVGIHAMLEFPLHYAYFLLPVGLVMGMLNADLNIAPLNFPRARAIMRPSSIAIYLGGLLLLGLTIRDYFAVEEATEIMRLQKANVRTKAPAQAPEVLVLTHLRHQVAYFLEEPQSETPQKSLQLYTALTTAYPSSYNIMKLITILTLNSKLEDAEQWMRKAPYVMDQTKRSALPKDWEGLQAQYPMLGKLDWVNALKSPNTE